MNYELAKKLKDAGFKYSWCSDLDKGYCIPDGCFPTLSELIEACGKICLWYANSEWHSFLVTEDMEDTGDISTWYVDVSNVKVESDKTPEEAVANLWLALAAEKREKGVKEDLKGE